MRARVLLTTFACLLIGALATCSAALAYREPVKQGNPVAEQAEQWITEEQLGRIDFTFLRERKIEGACGLAISPSGDLYVSDYYHRAIHAFTLAGMYGHTELLKGGGNPPASLEPVNQLNAVCGLAVAADGSRYASEFHQRVLQMPGEAVVDAGPSTGIAVGPDGDLYVDDRTYVAVYDAPIVPGEAAAMKIGGLGNLVEANGVAVDFETGRVYVPEAASGTVKVFDPAVSLTTPVDTIEGPEGTGEPHFHSLQNASVAVDNSSTGGKGHVLVVDNLKPGLEFPQTAIYEFEADGTFLGQLAPRSVGPPGEKHQGPIFAEPPGIAVNPETGDLFVTTGNSEDANVVKYGPYLAAAPPPSSGGSASSGGSGSASGARLDGGGGEGAPRGGDGGASASVVEQRRGVRVSFDGKLNPHVLPRHGTAPVGIVVDAKIGATGGQDPPQLRRITIAINRNGHFNSKGLPACQIEQIQPSTTANALAACRGSLVGEGHFSANVKLPEQSPFPSSGKVLAFNGKVNGRPAILAHIYGTSPAPTSIVLPFLMRGGHGTYGTTLEASLPQATGSWGYVTGLKMNLHRRFSYRGHSRSFLSAGCPAPAGFPGASFPLAKTSFSFAESLTVKAVLTRTCQARG